MTESRRTYTLTLKLILMLFVCRLSQSEPSPTLSLQMEKEQSDVQGLSDFDIWNLFRSGSDTAFHFIYHSYFDKLYNYGCHFTKDFTLVEDTLQDLFIELKRRCDHLSETDKILPYLYSAFRRKIIRSRDKQKRFEEHNPERSFAVVASIDELIMDTEQQRENQLKLQRALDELPENYREIIYLFYYENLGYEEIREIQGFENVKSARNLLYKALNTLKKGMSPILLVLLHMHNCFEKFKGI